MFIDLNIKFLNIISVSALSYQSNVGVGFSFNTSLSISMSSNDLVIPDLIAGTSDTSNNLNILVSTNAIYGYNLYVNTGNEGQDNTNLISNTSPNVFSSINLDANFTDLSDFNTNSEDNTWGYSYSLNSGSTWSNYNGLPIYSSASPTRLAKSSGPAEDIIQFKIAAKAASNQPSGVYTNTINFIAVTKPTPVTLADAYASAGKTLYKGYYKMQDMTTDICKETETIGAQLQVIDARDDKVYWISKLADNNCWMTQNLDLDLISDPTAENYITLTSENTDLSDTTSPAYQEGYTTDESGVITWIPERGTIAYNNLNSTTWQNDSNHPYSYDYLDSNGNPVYPDSNATQQIAGNHGLSGNYYNWPASVASNNSTNATGSLSNSICPSNFKLPDIIKNEFGNLLVSQGIKTANSTSYLNENGMYLLTSSPLYFVRSGNIDHRSKLVNYNRYGRYWVGSSHASVYKYLLFFSDSYINQSYYEINNGNIGQSIRCLAR